MNQPDGSGPAWRAALWSAVFVVVVAAGANFVSSARLTSFRDSTQHGEHLIAALSALRGHLVDAETGQRGYLLTGQPAYLAPYSGARAKVREDLSSLDSLLTDGDSSRLALVELKRLAAAKLSELDSTVVLKQEANASGAMAIVLSQRGRFLMDSTRSLVRAVSAREESQMVEGGRSEERWAKYVLLGLLLGAAITLGVLLHLLRTLALYERSQHAAQQEMNLQVAELERMARERATSAPVKT